MSAPTEDFNTQMLAVVRQALIDFVEDGGQHTVSLGGVSFTYASLDDLMKLETMFASRVKADEMRAEGVTPYAIRTRMVTP